MSKHLMPMTPVDPLSLEVEPCLIFVDADKSEVVGRLYMPMDAEIYFEGDAERIKKAFDAALLEHIR